MGIGMTRRYGYEQELGDMTAFISLVKGKPYNLGKGKGGTR